jgi:hypothetical protein
MQVTQQVVIKPCKKSVHAICRPTTLGGLGLPDLQARGLALRTRWMWQAWNDPSKPWQGLLLPVDDRVRALFNASVRFHLGDGNKIKFWTDPWIDG